MTKPLGVLGLLVALAPSSLLMLPHQDAQAADDDRRVLRARHMETVNPSEEYRRLAREKRMESIRFLKDLLARGDAQGDRKAEMMLRLADLYFKEGRDLYLTEMGAFDVEYDACFNAEDCNPEKMQPDNSESAEWQERSIKLYKQILASYPRYARADEATFYLASALSDLGRKEESTKAFVQLVKQYSDSPFVPESYINIGEYYFDQDNAYKALVAYKKATGYPNSDKYGYALYMLAWSYYNVGEYGKSITTMKAVVTYSMSEAEANAKSKLQLQEEALKDLVRFFADAGELDEAYDYFNRLGKKDLIRSMLQRLAKMYFEQGKWEATVQTYRRLISEDPQARDNPMYQHEIVQAYQKMGNRDATFTEIDRMLKTYGSNSAWARAHASDEAIVKEAQEKIEKDLLQVATYYHERARKLNGEESKDSYVFAYKAYSVYLDEFPQSKNSYEVRYQFAELLYKVKRYAEAFKQYMAVVDMDPSGKHSRFCAESAIFAADEMVKREQKESPSDGPTKSADGKPEPQDLTEWEQRLADSCLKYARLYPDDKKVRNIIYKSAYLLYNKARFAEAATQFREVIKLDPRSSEAEKAAHLILDSFVLTNDYDNLKENAKFYYDQEGLGSNTFKKEVYAIYQKASLKVIEIAFDKTKDFGGTADAYLEFAREFPESDELARVLNNTALYYRKANRIADSMKVRHQLVEDPRFGSKTKYYYDQISNLGFDYESIADFDKAAHYYELMYSLYPKEREKLQKTSPDDAEALSKLDETAAAALYSAALFRKAQGDATGAISNFKQFLATFPDDSKTMDIRFTIGHIYEDQEDWAQAGNVYFNIYTKADATTKPDYVYFSRLRYGKALEAQGQHSKAKRLYEETVALYQRFVKAGGQAGPYTEFVAEMMYDLAQPTFDDYAKREIRGCDCTSRRREDRDLEANLKGKAKSLVEVESTYADIIRTGAGEWGLAALVQLGRAYENMATSLEGSSIPFYLTDDQREIYEMALEDKVYPQTEKAASAYRAALDKSYELMLYNDNTAFATRRLGELRPDQYPGLFEDVPQTHLTSQSTHIYDFETEL